MELIFYWGIQTINKNYNKEVSYIMCYMVSVKWLVLDDSVRCVGVMNGSTESKLLSWVWEGGRWFSPALSTITFKEWGFSNTIKRLYIMTKWTLFQGCKESSTFANQYL